MANTKKVEKSVKHPQKTSHANDRNVKDRKTNKHNSQTNSSKKIVKKKAYKKKLNSLEIKNNASKEKFECLCAEKELKVFNYIKPEVLNKSVDCSITSKKFSDSSFDVDVCIIYISDGTNEHCEKIKIPETIRGQHLAIERALPTLLLNRFTNLEVSSISLVNVLEENTPAIIIYCNNFLPKNGTQPDITTLANCSVSQISNKNDFVNDELSIYNALYNLTDSFCQRISNIASKPTSCSSVENTKCCKNCQTKSKSSLDSPLNLHETTEKYTECDEKIMFEKEFQNAETQYEVDTSPTIENFSQTSFYSNRSKHICNKPLSKSTKTMKHKILIPLQKNKVCCNYACISASRASDGLTLDLKNEEKCNTIVTNPDINLKLDKVNESPPEKNFAYKNSSYSVVSDNVLMGSDNLTTSPTSYYPSEILNSVEGFTTSGTTSMDSSDKMVPVDSKSKSTTHSASDHVNFIHFIHSILMQIINVSISNCQSNINNGQLENKVVDAESDQVSNSSMQVSVKKLDFGKSRKNETLIATNVNGVYSLSKNKLENLEFLSQNEESQTETLTQFENKNDSDFTEQMFSDAVITNVCTRVIKHFLCDNEINDASYSVLENNIIKHIMMSSNIFPKYKSSSNDVNCINHCINNLDQGFTEGLLISCSNLSKTKMRDICIQFTTIDRKKDVATMTEPLPQFEKSVDDLLKDGFLKNSEINTVNNEGENNLQRTVTIYSDVIEYDIPDQSYSPCSDEEESKEDLSTESIQENSELASTQRMQVVEDEFKIKEKDTDYNEKDEGVLPKIYENKTTGEQMVSPRTTVDQIYETKTETNGDELENKKKNVNNESPKPSLQLELEKKGERKKDRRTIIDSEEEAHMGLKKITTEKLSRAMSGTRIKTNLSIIFPTLDEIDGSHHSTDSKNTSDREKDALGSFEAENSDKFVRQLKAPSISYKTHNAPRQLSVANSDIKTALSTMTQLKNKTNNS